MILNSKDLPPLQFITRSKSGVTMYSMKDGDRTPEKVDFFSSSCCEEVYWSNNGEYCVYRETEAIRVFDMKERCELYKLPLSRVVAVSISPQNRWLVTLSPYKSTPNLQIWNLQTGDLHFAFVQKSFFRSYWPYLQWDNEECRAMFHSNETVIICDGHDFTNETKKQVINGSDCSLYNQTLIDTSSTVSFSPSPSCPAFVVFTPNKQGNGTISYFADKRKGEGNQFSLELQRNVMNCSSGVCEWNANGDRAVITASNDVDTSGVSYYGSNYLYYLFNDYKPRTDCLLNILRGELSIQQSHFSQDGSKLCAVTTSVPAETSLFSTKECQEEGTCGKLNVNTILWSPHGRLLALAGFGNLSGEVILWDNIEKRKLLMFKTSYVTSCQWSNDSRLLVMGTCYPRMKIDNKLYIYKYNGVLLYEENVDLLYDISIRPTAKNTYPLRPPTEEELSEIKQAVAKKAPTKYVPPHLRGSASAASSRTTNRVVGRGPQRPNSLPPRGVKSVPVPVTPKQDVGVNLIDVIFASAAKNTDKEALEKRLKTLTKKLREITQLKGKAILNEEQVLKVGKEQEILKEMKEVDEKLKGMK